MNVKKLKSGGHIGYYASQLHLIYILMIDMSPPRLPEKNEVSHDYIHQRLRNFMIFQVRGGGRDRHLGF